MSRTNLWEGVCLFFPYPEFLGVLTVLYRELNGTSFCLHYMVYIVKLLEYVEQGSDPNMVFNAVHDLGKGISNPFLNPIRLQNSRLGISCLLVRPTESMATMPI